MAHIVVLMTAAHSEQANTIARALVEERLAACVSMAGGITSCYRWQGQVTSESEVLLIAKTRADLFDRLVCRVRELHSYTTPEIIALPMSDGFADYLRWIDQETG